VLWSVIVLLLIALVGGAVVGVILAFGLNTVIEAAKSLRRGTARR
jgi:hypothetical protein